MNFGLQENCIVNSGVINCAFLFMAPTMFILNMIFFGAEYDILLSYNADKNHIWLYVNGDLAEEKSLGSAAPLSIEGKSYIGGYISEDRFFIGEMDLFRVWNKNLNPTKLKQRLGRSRCLVSYSFEEIEGSYH